MRPDTVVPRPFVGVIGSGNIGRDPWDPRSFSGISRNLFQALQSRGALSRAFGVEVPAPRRYALMGLNYQRDRHLWRTKFYLDKRYYRALTAAVEREMTDADLGGTFLQLGAYYDVPSIAAGRAPCTSYHDGNIAQMMYSPYFPTALRREAEAAFEWERGIYRRLTAVFTMSEYLRQSFIHDFGVDEDRVFNVGAGPNFEVPAEVPPKDFETKKILFVGIDFDRKGGPTLLDAFRIVRQRYSDAELHLVGPRTRPEGLRDASEGVVFHGLLSRQEPEQRKTFFSLLESCTLFVMPSRYEPYGVAVVEAMVYGMPAIATDRWAFPEMIGDTGAVVALDDSEAMADRICWMLEDPERRAALGRRARARVLEKFSWDLVADRMLEAVTR